MTFMKLVAVATLIAAVQVRERSLVDPTLVTGANTAQLVEELDQYTPRRWSASMSEPDVFPDQTLEDAQLKEKEEEVADVPELEIFSDKLEILKKVDDFDLDARTSPAYIPFQAGSLFIPVLLCCCCFLVCQCISKGVNPCLKKIIGKRIMKKLGIAGVVTKCRICWCIMKCALGSCCDNSSKEEDESGEEDPDLAEEMVKSGDGHDDEDSNTSLTKSSTKEVPAKAELNKSKDCAECGKKVKPDVDLPKPADVLYSDPRNYLKGNPSPDLHIAELEAALKKKGKPALEHARIKMESKNITIDIFGKDTPMDVNVSESDSSAANNVVDAVGGLIPK